MKPKKFCIRSLIENAEFYTSNRAPPVDSSPLSPEPNTPQCIRLRRFNSMRRNNIHGVKEEIFKFRIDWTRHNLTRFQEKLEEACSLGLILLKNNKETNTKTKEYEEKMKKIQRSQEEIRILYEEQQDKFDSYSETKKMLEEEYDRINQENMSLKFRHSKYKRKIFDLEKQLSETAESLTRMNEFVEFEQNELQVGRKRLERVSSVPTAILTRSFKLPSRSSSWNYNDNNNNDNENPQTNLHLHHHQVSNYNNNIQQQQQQNFDQEDSEDSEEQTILTRKGIGLRVHLIKRRIMAFRKFKRFIENTVTELEEDLTKNMTHLSEKFNEQMKTLKTVEMTHAIQQHRVIQNSGLSEMYNINHQNNNVNQLIIKGNKVCIPMRKNYFGKKKHKKKEGIVYLIKLPNFCDHNNSSLSSSSDIIINNNNNDKRKRKRTKKKKKNDENDKNIFEGLKKGEKVWMEVNSSQKVVMIWKLKNIIDEEGEEERNNHKKKSSKIRRTRNDIVDDQNLILIRSIYRMIIFSQDQEEEEITEEEEKGRKILVIMRFPILKDYEEKKKKMMNRKRKRNNNNNNNNNNHDNDNELWIKFGNERERNEWLKIINEILLFD